MKRVLEKFAEKEIEAFLSSIGLLSLDIESAKIAGAIYSELERKGEMIEAEDGLIAGIAQYHHDTVLTRNLKHFERIRSIRTKTY